MDEVLLPLLDQTPIIEINLTNTKALLSQTAFKGIAASKTLTKLLIEGIALYPGFEDYLGKTIIEKMVNKAPF